MHFSPEELYRRNLSQYNSALQQLQKRRKRLGWIRFTIFILTIIICYQVFVQSGWLGLIPLLTGLGFMLFLVSKDTDNNQQIAHLETLIQLNEEELKILQHNFHQRFDGSAFLPHVHDYANDLDLFGEASLYQYIQRCHSGQGRMLLAKNLLEGISRTGMENRQQAIREMAPELSWRQEFEAYSKRFPISILTENRTLTWLEQNEAPYQQGYWKIILLIYPFITLGCMLASLAGWIPAGIFSFCYGIFLAFSLLLSSRTIKSYSLLSGIVKEIGTLQILTSWIEKKDFHSGLWQELRTKSESSHHTPSWQIAQLKKILDRFDLRLNIAGILFFNAFLLWDLRQMTALNEWRKINRNKVASWFELIAETEVLHSLASLHFNHPSWCFPAFSSQHFTLKAAALGHPLIAAGKSVTNSFETTGEGKINLITGSNMAGKSTFLRSLGVNMVLAQMGSCVCAQSFELSPARLITSMRIADNLAENTSTFYAELKKLKTIIEAVNRKEKLFILLDEILRGTNSLDRHTGSAALIRQFIAHDAVALIATHDVELARLENDYPGALLNYHFDVQVEGEELYFDYRLRQGVCKSLNASLLMKKIGIELT